MQAQIINLLKDLRDRLGLSYIFVAHDLSVVRQIADRVAVMYLGEVVEVGDEADVLLRPSHPYTQALVSALPTADTSGQMTGNRIVLSGDLPRPRESALRLPVPHAVLDGAAKCRPRSRR